ncbi:MAG TPA: hypothetical protein VGV15_11765 [Terriglobales bacterium]|nr:hypothetical protein [Terriglobales bacterium]
MLVKILKFGSNWWARFGHDPRDRYRFTRHAAYFNSSGLCSGSKVKRHWIVPGLIRFNGVGDFNPQFPNRSVGVTFECADLVFALGGNRLLFQRKVAGCAQPDYFLVVLSADRHGTFDCLAPDWKPDSVRAIAVSQCGARQEAMLLLKPLDWVRTTLGLWQLNTRSAVSHSAWLELAEDGVTGCT